MIEEGFILDEQYWPNDDRWAAHYLLLTGYDDASQTFTGQDTFRGANQKIPITELDRLWQAFNRVYIMIYPPEKEAEIKSILGSNWDVEQNRQHALEVAQSEAQNDPRNAFAWFNVGTNLTFFEDYAQASDTFDTARNLGLPQRMLRYQFSPFIAYFQANQIDELMTLVKYALQRTRNSEEALLWQGWGYYRMGNKTEAANSFQKALEANPFYTDAKYALDFIGGNQ